MVAEEEVEYSLNRKASSLIQPARIIKFRWKPFAIAATIVGLIMTTTLIIFVKNKSNRNFAGKKPNKTLPIKNNGAIKEEIRNHFNDLLAKNILVPEETQISVLKEQSFGFAAKEEKLTIRKYYIKKKITELDYAITSEMNSEPGVEDGPMIKLLKDKRDSINNLANKYNFIHNVLSVYLSSEKEVKVLKINAAYYLIFEDQVYECKLTDNPVLLKEVTDEAILEKAKIILFNNSN